MATPTYELIETTTLSADASSVIFDLIPQTFRDLVLTCGNVNSQSTSTMRVTVNDDNTANYAEAWMYGDGSVDDADINGGTFYLRFSTGGGDITTTSDALLQLEIVDYSQTDKYKATIQKVSSNTKSAMIAGLWQSTNAVTKLEIKTNIAAGGIFSLYGIAG